MKIVVISPKHLFSPFESTVIDIELRMIPIPATARLVSNRKLRTTQEEYKPTTSWLVSFILNMSWNVLLLCKFVSLSNYNTCTVNYCNHCFGLPGNGMINYWMMKLTILIICCFLWINSKQMNTGNPPRWRSASNLKRFDRYPPYHVSNECTQRRIRYCLIAWLDLKNEIYHIARTNSELIKALK